MLQYKSSFSTKRNLKKYCSNIGKSASENFDYHGHYHGQCSMSVFKNFQATLITAHIFVFTTLVIFFAYVFSL